MAEDLHFLQRIERLSRPEAELALALYRDRDLVRFILDAGRLPERATRVALSLDDPLDGPFVVVTRDGDFVTCLGRGMRVGDRPVVTREQLGALAERFDVLRDRIVRAQQAVGEGGVLARIGRSLFRQRGIPTREDIQLILDVEPLLFGDLLELFVSAAEMLVSRRAHMASRLRRARKDPRRLDADERRSLVAWWELAWAAAHLSVVVAEGSRRRGAVLEDIYVSDVLTLTRTILARHPSRGLFVRDVWVAGRLGRRALPTVRDHLAGSDGGYGSIEALARLGAIGLRSTRVRAEARRLVAGAVLPAAAGASVDPGPVRDLVLRGFDDGEPVRAELLALARARCVERARVVARGAGPWQTAADVPEDAALAWAATFGRPVDAGPREAALGTMATLAVARCGAAELYLPATTLDALDARPDDDAIVKLLSRESVARTPARAAPKTGRNEPCPCGSGKKYKHCCGG